MVGYWSSMGWSVCKLCDAGKQSNAGSETSTNCPGQANCVAGGVCNWCPAGTYVSGDGQSSCTLCVADHVSGTDWGSSNACLEGTKKTSDSQCTSYPGQYKPYKAQTQCWECEAGKYSFFPDQVECTLCNESSLWLKTP